ncbi:hypothetical protein [Geobacter sp. OR-1]|uniref:hypothetical protein n=1 Tax=Geobacter sp. OR-1 TaxID=1266765 RepID=UPI000A634E29|nr:hypothetical protein [Geobacter sp. OR-1]
MKYKQIIKMWDEMCDIPWDELPEKRKVEFAYEEGRLSGYIDIAKMATKMSERKNKYL